MKVFTIPHHVDDAAKDIEIISLCRTKRMALKEWNDDTRQIIDRSHAIPIDRFTVIVSTTIDEDPPASKESLDGFEHFETSFSLCHDEFGEYLVAELRRLVPIATY